jgi:hypothetical protein
MRNNKLHNGEYIKGIFGQKFPKDFHYKISSKGELEEVKWLIKEGVYKSIKDYEEHTTKILLGEVKA